MDEAIYTKPVLKWAGGKSQLLGEIIPRMPEAYNNYIEPFFGRGAGYFAVAPDHAVIADSNPELINLYRRKFQRVCRYEYPVFENHWSNKRSGNGYHYRSTTFNLD